MKAMRIHDYGGSDQMHLEEAPVPSIDTDEVLVRVHMAGVNPVDWKLREGHMRSSAPLRFPYTMGQDFAGDVVETGRGVTAFAKGDRVFGFAAGAEAELAAAKADQIAKLPTELDDETAAALPVAGLTAYQLIEDVVKPGSGTTVLIHGAAGGVGSIAVQLAKQRGARVIANASQRDADYLEHLDVDRVVTYETQRFDELVKDVDAVIDLVGGETLARSYAVVKKGGILVSTVAPPDAEKARLAGITAKMHIMSRNGRQLAALADLVARGIVTPKLSQVMPLAEAPTAEDMSQHGKAHGKIVLKVL